MSLAVWRSPVPVWPGRSGAKQPVQLRCYSSVTPGHEFVQPCDFVIRDLGEGPCEPGLGIDLVELGGLKPFCNMLGCNDVLIIRVRYFQ